MGNCSQLYGPAGLDVEQLTLGPNREEAGWSARSVCMLYKNREGKSGVASVGDAAVGTEMGYAGSAALCTKILNIEI